MTDVAPTIDVAHAALQPWDAIVIGAGPAGALSACLLARARLRVLLVERRLFPRPKVCGGCLNAQAIAALARAGLVERVRGLGAARVNTLHLRQGGRSAAIEIAPGLAVSRRILDAELVSAAVEAGCAFLPGTTAVVESESTRPWREGWRRVLLQQPHGPGASAEGKAILVADGLSRSSLRDCTSFHGRVSPTARVGVGGEAERGSVEIFPGSITMAVGRHGYVGAVEVEGGRVNIAAAVDPDFLKAHVTPSRAIRSLLAEAGLGTGPGLDEVEWMGTIPLTRQLSRPAARGIFVIGDAAGYVEPFTGEGMAWAFAGAEAVVPFVVRATQAHERRLEREWIGAYNGGIRREQRWCRVVARVLRMPAIVTPLVLLLRRHPGLARPVLAHLAPRHSGAIGRTV